MTNFNSMEALFAQLICNIAKVFSNSEISEVESFLVVGEYGLALETLIDIFVEEKKLAEPSVVSLITEIAIAMHLDPTIYVNKLPKST
jgi:hypothetical protein